MENEILIHKVQQADIAALVQLMGDFYAIDGYPFDPLITTQNFALFIQQPDYGQCWLIKQAAQTLGYCIITYFFSFEARGRVAILDELYFTEDARGKGLGKYVVNFVQQYAKAQQMKCIALEVEEHNARAKELYSKQGFVMHHRQLMLYPIK